MLCDQVLVAERPQVGHARQVARGELGIVQESPALAVRAVRMGQDSQGGIQALPMVPGPVGIDRVFVQQAVVIDPLLDEQAGGRRRFRQRDTSFRDLVAFFVSPIQAAIQAGTVKGLSAAGTLSMAR